MGYGSVPASSFFGCRDWEQRRLCIAILRLDFSELTASGSGSLVSIEQ
uniref:Uncharacterized protein n=1 Tax=Populus trichocarpa TaxID=3694 RepID=A0A3N7EPC0_POPTR